MIRLVALLLLALLVGPARGAAPAGWVPLSSMPPHQMAPKMFFDPRSRHVVMIGMATGGDLRHDKDRYSAAWEWDGATWLPRRWNPPPGDAADARLAFDPGRGRFVLVSSAAQAGAFTITWELEEGVWARKKTPVAPPSRTSFGLVFDPDRNCLLLSGGRNAEGDLSDTWTWDGTSWKEASFFGPLSGEGARLIHDPKRHRIVAVQLDFRGACRVAGWDGKSWTVESGQGGKEFGRNGMTVGYDPFAGRLFAAGGSDATSCSRFDWTGAEWVASSSPPPPPCRGGAGTAWDEHRNVLVVFGGDVGYGKRDETVLEWDGKFWKRLAPGGLPPRSSMAAAIDPSDSRLLIFGGCAGYAALGDTWKLQGTKWVAIESGSPPAPRFQSAAASDGATGVLLFGGRQASGKDLVLSDETWRFERDHWSELRLEDRPPARFGHALAAAPDGILLYGGRGSRGFLDDVWRWDGAAWRPVAHGPGKRAHHAMAYDPGRKRFTIFGGYEDAKARPSGETWEFDGTAWNRPSPASGPAARGFASMSYDPVRRRLVLHGGLAAPCEQVDDPRYQRFRGHSDTADTWEWDGTAWTRRAAAPPGERNYPVTAYSAPHDGTVLFGGMGPDSELRDLWLLGH